MYFWSRTDEGSKNLLSTSSWMRVKMEMELPPYEFDQVAKTCEDAEKDSKTSADP